MTELVPFLGIVSPSWEVLWCPQGPKKVVEQVWGIFKMVKWRSHMKPRRRSLHIYSGSRLVVRKPWKAQETPKSPLKK
mgnify:CR=1 FL=1